MHLEFRQILWGARPDSMGHRGKLMSLVPSPLILEGDRAEDNRNESRFAPRILSIHSQNHRFSVCTVSYPGQTLEPSLLNYFF